MRNPWLDIPLNEYEEHMSLPAVDQAGLLAEEFGRALHKYAPKSVAIIGCAGGNGFERIDPQITKRVVAIDINPNYVAAVRERFGGPPLRLETCVADIEGLWFSVSPVELVYVALLLEYVDVARTVERIADVCSPGGILVTLIQLPSTTRTAVTQSPFSSVQSLVGAFQPVSPEELNTVAALAGFRLLDGNEVTSSPGKRFVVQTFRREAQ